MNLSLVRIYNALEILLLRAIKLKYSPNLKVPLNDKKGLTKIENSIKKHFKSKGHNYKKNNRYIIQFLQDKSKKFTSFLTRPVRVDLTTDWENFYVFISILRNIISHNEMVVDKSAFNNIESIANDIFQKYFYLPDRANDGLSLDPKEDAFAGFITLINDFAANNVKFIFNKSDLSFIGLS